MAPDSPAAKAEDLEKGDIVYEINGTRVDNLKVSECIEIIRAATEQLTVTLIKKPKEVKPVEEPKAEKKKKPKSKRGLYITSACYLYSHFIFILVSYYCFFSSSKSFRTRDFVFLLNDDKT